MEYTPVKDIADALAEHIRTVGIFKRVTYAQASNGAQVWQMLEAMANLPCAVVTIGTVDYDSDALKRTIRPMIFIVGEFDRWLAGDAAGIWDLTEEVLRRFLPEESGDGLYRPEICGIEFTPESAAPIQSDDNVAAYMITLTGVEFLTQ